MQIRGGCMGPLLYINFDTAPVTFHVHNYTCRHIDSHHKLIWWKLVIHGG